jgi:hypothetical protein
MHQAARLPRLLAPTPDRVGATATGPQPGERDRSGDPEAELDRRSGKEKPGVELAVDGTYGGLTPVAGQGDSQHSTTETVTEKDGDRAYTREVQRSDDPGAQPMGSTVESGTGRPDRM